VGVKAEHLNDSRLGRVLDQLYEYGTARPTLRWILQCFLSVHLVFVDGIKSSIQLTDRQ
jgi:Domain of unknown function (DUF4277)